MSDSCLLVILDAAERDLASLDPAMSGRADAAIVDLSFTPRPPGSRKLAGREDMWRVRIGDWRILYRIDDAAPRVTVARVLHRSQAYR